MLSSLSLEEHRDLEGSGHGSLVAQGHQVGIMLKVNAEECCAELIMLPQCE